MSRPPAKGLVYVRRSSNRQEASLATQLNWAIEEATRLGVELLASQDDLEFMQRAGLSCYKALRLDDAISGADLSRPGFQSICQDSIRDESISHVFVSPGPACSS